MKYCANCGSKLADNMRFCPECGFDQRIYRPEAGGSAEPETRSSADREESETAGSRKTYDHEYTYQKEGASGRNQEDPFRERRTEPVYDREPSQYRGLRSWDYPFQPRSIALAIIFSIITFGIYFLYWLYQLVKSWNYISRVQGRKPGMSPGLVLLLSIVTFGVFNIYYWYRISRQIAELDDRNGEPLEDHSIVCLLFALFGLGIVSASIVQNSLNFYLDYEM